MALFDKIREKNKVISFIIKMQNTALYPALFALVCVFSGTAGKEVYIPCIWALTVFVAITTLFADDLKVLMVPFILIYYGIGMDVKDSYYFPRYEAGNPTFDKSAIPHFAACAVILLAVILYKLISRKYISEILKKRGVFFWGIILLDIALLLGGVFSTEFRLKSLLFSALIAVTLTVCYMVFTVIIAHSKDGIAYVCKIIVILGFLIFLQLCVIGFRLYLNDNLFLEQNGKIVWINRVMLVLSWGNKATIVGAMFVLPISAALYLAHSRRLPILSLLSAFLFWLMTIVIDTRAAIVFGAFALFVGIILCCINGKNKRIMRITMLTLCILLIIAFIVLICAFPETYDNLIKKVMVALRLDADEFTDVNDFLSNRITIWKDAIRDFLEAPLFGKGLYYGYNTPNTATPPSKNLFSNMYHNILLQFLASFGIFGLLMLFIHFKHLVEVLFRRFSTDKFLLLLTPAVILGMSLFDNFFFYPNFIIIYTVFLACSEISLEQKRKKRLENLKTAADGRKPRVAFTYVEAGKGHIIPTKTVCECFKRKYGDKVDVIESKFFTETGSPDMQKTEVLFRKAVQNQNRSPLLSLLCKLGNIIAGDTFALVVLLKLTVSGRKTNPLAVKHISDLDADVIYSAHWSIPFYVNQLKTPRPYTICFCPDVYSNGAFDVDCNNFLISSDVGYKQAERMRMYAGGNVTQVPFPMRPEVDEYKTTEKKLECRQKLGIAPDDFVAVLCDGGYGMARLGSTVKHLLRKDTPMTVIAMCGMNQPLYEKLLEASENTSKNIRLIPVSFTDNVLDYIACADVFVGKSGANSIAEPAALGIPIIVTKCITYIERGIKNYYVHKIKGAVYVPNSAAAARRIEKFAKKPALKNKYKNNLKNSTRQSFNAEASADIIWLRICDMYGRDN